jgi:hypothetical protein
MAVYTTESAERSLQSDPYVWLAPTWTRYRTLSVKEFFLAERYWFKKVAPFAFVYFYYPVYCENIAVPLALL